MERAIRMGEGVKWGGGGWGEVGGEWYDINGRVIGLDYISSSLFMSIHQARCVNVFLSLSLPLSSPTLTINKLNAQYTFG